MVAAIRTLWNKIFANQKTSKMKLPLGLKVGIGIVAVFIILGLIFNWKGVIPVGLWALAAWTLYRAKVANDSGSRTGGSWNNPKIVESDEKVGITNTHQFKFFVILALAAFVVTISMLAGH